MHYRNRGWALVLLPLFFVMVSLACTGCASGDQEPVYREVATEVVTEMAPGDDPGRLADLEREMATIAAEREWSGHYLRGARVKSAWVDGEDLLIEAFNPTSRDYEIHAVALKTGVPRWVVVLGKTGLKHAPRAGDRFVVCLLDQGGGMVVINRITGAREFRPRAPLRTVPAGPAASSDSTVYLASLVDNRVHALSPDSGQKGWHYRAMGTINSGPLVTPSVPRRLVVFGTDAGEVIALHTVGWNEVAPEGPSWERRLLDQVAGPMTVAQLVVEGRPEIRIMVPAEDNALYCLDGATGESVWVSRTKSAFRSEAGVANGRVYARNQDRMLVLDLATGAEVWPRNEETGLTRFEQADRVLTGDDQRAYLDFGNQRVGRVDGKTGEVLSQATLGRFDMLLATGDVNLLVGLTNDGHIVAYR